MTQEHKSKSTQGKQQDEVEKLPESEVAKRKEARDAEIDDLLGEIDGVLEENAQAFVDQYVQKGGE